MMVKTLVKKADMEPESNWNMEKKRDGFKQNERNDIYIYINK